MANENQPLLHFGDEPEDINNSQNVQPTTQIRFGETEETPAKETKQPVSNPKPQANPAPRPSVAPQPTQPVKQEVKTPVAQPVRTAVPQQPKPQVTAPKINESFGKKNMQINLIVVNGAGVVIPQFKVDHTVVKSGQEITFNDAREVYEITVSADGYKERRVQITQTDLIKGEKRISLATQLQSFVVSFNTPDGIKRGSVDIDQTNAIYDFIKDASHTDTPLNELVIGGIGGHKPVQQKNPLLPYLIALAIGLVLGIGISSLFSCGGSKEETKDQTEVVQEDEQKDDEVNSKDQNQTLDPQSEEEKAEEAKVEEQVEEKAEEDKKDEKAEEETKEEPKSAMGDSEAKYLKENDTWKRDAAKGDDSKKLLAAFCSGNIDYIVSSNAYNNLPDKQRNGYYNKVLADLKKISTQSNVDDAKAALRDACKNGDINLKAILNRTHPMLRK